MTYRQRLPTRLTWSIPQLVHFSDDQRLYEPLALSNIGSMSPARLSLSMVVSPQSPLPFHLAKAL